MTKEQALNYLKSSGFSKEQIQAIVEALSCSENLSSGTRKNSEKLEKGTTRNDIRDNRVKDELNQDKNELEPTIKNDLAVDKTFYDLVVEYCNEHFLVLVEKDVWDDARKALTTKNDLTLIHTEGLDEGIRCAMCTNSMKSDRGCDGSCVVNKGMYKAVMDVIENHIVDTDKMVEPTTKNDLGVDTDKLIADCEKMSFDIELFGRPMKALLLDAVKNIVKDLPLVPQEPKSDWAHDHEILRAYADGANNVLEKIRSEIQSLRNCSCSCSDGIIDDVEDIIDKYKTESENKK